MAGRVSKRQVGVVMDTFKKGKLRRPGGKKITSRKQAIAVALSEGRAAASRGTSKRTYMGRTRTRPKLKGG